jgi:hypothetical protein
MIRDEEINRLIRYAQGMGISVRFKPYVPHSKDEAEWTIDGTEITIYVRSSTSKLDKVLSLIHELGHHKAFVNNDRSIDPKLEEALDSEENKKNQRRAIYMDEKNGTKYWEEIYRDTNCQFGIPRLHMQMELDLWTYEVYLETGKWPTRAKSKKKRKQLKLKYKVLK